MSGDASNFLETYRQYPMDNDTHLHRQLVNGYTDIALAVNSREIGSYSTDIKPTGQQWFGTGNSKIREGKRVVLQVSSILNGVTTVKHGIAVTSKTTITNIYGTASDGTNGIPLPCPAIGAADVVQMTWDANNVYLTTTAATYTLYAGTIVVEFV